MQVLSVYSDNRVDSGETVALGAKAVSKAIDEGLCGNGDIVTLLRKLTQIIDGRVQFSFLSMRVRRLNIQSDSCGGTLGAIFSIYLAALAAEVRDAARDTNGKLEGFPWGKVVYT